MNLTKEWVSKNLPVRAKDANKGTFGKILVIGGSEKYPGAAYLNCAAAYRVGAGLVTLATEEEVKIIVSRKLPEVTFLSRNEILKEIDDYGVLLIGSGLGQNDETVELVKGIIKKDMLPTVIDGDGLNILSRMEKWWEELKGKIILTPHPGEMSRLTGITVKEIQSNRIKIAKKYAEEWKQVVILKGANTVIANSFGQVLISPFVNPALATAGTGDIVSGIISGMLAQGLKPFEAAGVSVYIHGIAGEKLSKEIGQAGVLASDLLPILPLVIKELV